MSQYQRLLLIADPSLHRYEGLYRAAALAQASGAALHISAFIEALPLFDERFGEVTRESYLQEHFRWITDEAALLRGKGLTVTTEVIWCERQLEEILQHVVEMQPDMVIKDVQHEPAFKRAFITPLDWHLLRDCPVPLHLVSSEGGRALPKVVIAAVDPSHPQTQIADINDDIIKAANALALQCNAQLHLLHTYDLSSVYVWDGTAGLAGATVWAADLIDDMRDSLRKAFDTLAERYGVAAEQRHFLMGQPIKAIAESAVELQADVIVMGTVQRKGLNKLVGSTTEYLLYRAPCSILAIKPGSYTATHLHN